MGKKSLPNGFWTDFDGLLEIYKQDFEIAKKMDKATNEIDFINVHVLPQFEKHLKEDGGLPMQKLAYKKIVDYLKSRVLELQQAEANKEKGYLFAVDKTVCPVQLDNGGLRITRTQMKFYLDCLDEVNSRNEVVKLATEKNYIAHFYIKLSKVKLYELNDFLDCHYSASNDQNRFLNLLKALLACELKRHPASAEFVSNWLNSKLESSKQIKSNSLRSSEKKKSISYQWQGNAEVELPKLHQRLINAEMIDGQTDLKDFTATFTGQPTNNIKPIKWIAQVNLLAYFLWSEFKGKNWASITEKGKLFIKDGNQITANTLSSSKAQCMGFEKPPMGSKKIDEILSAIKKH